MPNSYNMFVMSGPNILYISGSIGLGHVANDYAIAKKIREINPEADITWIATNPANNYLKEKDQKLHPLSKKFSSYSTFAEKASGKSQLNLIKYVMVSLIGWIRNVVILKRIIRHEHFDLIVGNETYEVLIALIFRLVRFKVPFVIIFDFLGLDSMTKSFFENIAVYILNWIWSRDKKIFFKTRHKAIFIGEPEDIPDNKFGLLLPNRREYAKKYYHFLGYVISFDPDQLSNVAIIKEILGYKGKTLIICSIGGTSIGKDLLELCVSAFPILRRSIKNLHMILVTGPRLSPDELKVRPGIEIKGFVPDLYRYFSACDLAIVQGGGTSTLELSALNRPFIYFPIKGHSEQKLVAERLERYHAGVRMELSRTTPDYLAKHILQNIQKPVSYGRLNTDGAIKAATIICSLTIPQENRR